MSVREAAAAIRGGEISATAYVDAQLADAAAAEWIGALVSLDAPLVRAQAAKIDRKHAAGAQLGRLAGVPFVIKDNIDAAGWATTCCTPALEGNRPSRDAEVVSGLRSADAVVLGKAVMHELAMGGTSNNPHMARVRNPASLPHIASGSSGGTAAAIAAGYAPFGLGSDTGGSVPIPAALCGVAGLRPSMGRYSQVGLLVGNPTRDTAGPMARTADDLRLIDAVLAGAEEVDPPAPGTIRLGMPQEYWQDLDEPLRAVMDNAHRRLLAAGIEIVPLELGELTELSAVVARGLRTEPSFHLADALAALPLAPSIEEVAAASHAPEIAAALRLAAAGRGTHEELRHARDVVRPKLRAAFQDTFDHAGVAALFVPTTPLAAAELDVGDTVTINGREHDLFVYTRHTLPVANAGLPFLTVPAGRTGDGRPVGAGLIGPCDSDATLLAIGTTVQRALGGAAQPAEGSGSG